MSDINPRCYSYVRFSTPEQAKGDSLRRQLERTREYARNHGLELDDELTIKDIGVSGYTGENIERGQLGVFYQAIINGRVAPGSVLVVESLDRLSRSAVIDALPRFLDIIKKKIKIVTLVDGQEYTEQSIGNNPSQLYISIASMMAANEESRKKSYRLTEVWENKRKHAMVKPMTSLSPAWVSFNNSTGEFIKDEHRSNIVQNIFNMYENGYGIRAIAKFLNENGEPSWKCGTGWHSSYVNKILKSRAVIGEFQPRTLSGSRRIPAGKVIKGYYPQVIDDGQFRRVQGIMAQRVISGAGRVGPARNLFTGIVKCGYCGSPMVYVNKGQPPKGGTYLVCDTSRRGLGCEYHSMRYESFEEGFLLFCRGLDVTEIVPDDRNRNREILELTKRLHETENLYREVDLKRQNLRNAIAKESSDELQSELMEEIETVIQEKNVLKTKMAELKVKVSTLQSQEEVLGDAVQDIDKLFRLIRQVDDAGKKARVKLRSVIKSIVEKIEVLPRGRIMTKELFREKLRVFSANMTDGEFESEWQQWEAVHGGSDRSDVGNREFTVKFISGNTLRMVSSDKGMTWKRAYEKLGDDVQIDFFGRWLKLSNQKKLDDAEVERDFKAMFGEAAYKRFLEEWGE